MTNQLKLCARCAAPLEAEPRTERSETTMPDGRPVWTLILADSIAHMQTLPAESFDAVITDPPYGSGGMTRPERMKSARDKYVDGRSSYAAASIPMAGDNLLPEQWSENMRAFTRETCRLLAPGRPALIFIDWRNLYAIYSVVASAGLTARGLICWNKGRGARPWKGGFRKQTEFIHWSTKGSVSGDCYLDGLFQHTTRTNNKRHISEKPLGLMRDLLQVATPGGGVLDPFAGSATTGVAAIERGCWFLGYEVVPEMFEIAVARLREVCP